MEPRKPADQLEILQHAQDADESELREYEKLLSQRFAADPDNPASGLESVARDGTDDRARLRELYKKFAKRIKP
jgi:hypothetical protein